MKKQGEILAPVGSAESLYAAVRAGADAVYMGAKNFNARIKADNFSDDELRQAIEYCHARNVKVNITMNTLISDKELPEALETVEKLCRWGADALILQDLGLASLVRRAAPDMERHASTQMSVQTVEGVRLLEKLGYCRVVLPREMTREEIKNIKSNTDCEIEIFVHGAHCMSVSGQCYMSAMFGSRSGNRGHCAQPCRLPFRVEGGTGYDLSLKDLSLIEKIAELEEIGIDSYKIEGRMKRPEYVAAAVTSVLASREGKADSQVKNNLRAVFSRSGFSDGYFENQRGRQMFGIRQREDVTAATSTVLSDLRKLYEKERAHIPVDFYLTVIEGENVSLSASALGRMCFVEDEFVPERAINKPLTKEGLAERISKCGGTQFVAGKIEIDLDEGLIVPASVINNLRRNALAELENKLKAVKAPDFTAPQLKLPAHKAKAPVKYRVRVVDEQQIPEDLSNVEYLYFPVKNVENLVEKVKKLPIKAGIELPRGIFGGEKVVENYLLKAKEGGINIAYCSTIDAVALAKKHGFEIHSGFSMNVFNSHSVAVLESLGVKDITLSPELTLKEAAAVGGGAQRGIIGYGRLPLMLTRNCPVGNGRSCKECKSTGFLTDRKNFRFPVMCSFGCSEIFNSQPIYLGDRLNEIENLEFITFFFTNESKQEVQKVMNAYKEKTAFEGDYTRGLYYRGVE